MFCNQSFWIKTNFCSVFYEENKSFFEKKIVFFLSLYVYRSQKNIQISYTRKKSSKTLKSRYSYAQTTVYFSITQRFGSLLIFLMGIKWRILINQSLLNVYQCFFWRNPRDIPVCHIKGILGGSITFCARTHKKTPFWNSGWPDVDKLFLPSWHHHRRRRLVFPFAIAAQKLARFLPRHKRCQQTYVVVYISLVSTARRGAWWGGAGASESENTFHTTLVCWLLGWEAGSSGCWEVGANYEKSENPFIW